MGGIVGGALLGIGLLGSMGKKSSSYEMATNVHADMTQSLPTAPETPAPTASTAPDGATSENALMEEERERARQQALIRSQRAPELFTSGLGATGLAETAKKTLLGG